MKRVWEVERGRRRRRRGEIGEESERKMVGFRCGVGGGRWSTIMIYARRRWRVRF